MPVRVAYDGRNFHLMPIRQLNLREALALVPYTAGAAALISAGLVTIKAARSPSFPYAGVVDGLAAATLVAAAALNWWMRRRPMTAPSWMDERGAIAWTLGLQLGVLLLVVPVFALVTHVDADDLHWNWPYLNKRWLVALYSLAIGTFVVFPVAFQWWRAPAAARVSGREAIASRVPRSWIVRLGGLAAIIALVWYFGGPPWHLDRHHRWIESHEEAHLGALQAISKGYLPYVGPASTQYGPGSQLLVHQIMKRARGFDIVSFRTAFASFQFVTLLIVAIAAYAWLGLASASAVVVLAVIYSPLAFYGTASDGTLSGFYGWGNGFRTITPIVVVPMLVQAAGVDPARPPLASPWVVLLGGVWGVGSWMAQENLSSTAIAAGLLLSLLCLTQTIAIGRGVRIARDLLIGFAIAVALPLVYYAMHGALGEFLDNYFGVPRAVASGFTNTWWPAQESGARTFYAAPVLFLAMTIATLWRLPSLTLNTPLDLDRTRLLAFLSVTLVCYQVSLLRSDAGHLQNTMMAAPFVLVLGALSLPRWLESRTLGRRTIRGGFVIAALAIFPAGKLLQARQILVTPYRRFVTGGAAVPVNPALPIADARATPLLSDEPEAISGADIPMRTALDFANEISAIVGHRKAYVGAVGPMWSGTLMFLADLTPAPYPLDRDTMTINEVREARVVEHIRTHPDDYECLISDRLESPEARAFLAVHPGAQRLERRLGTVPIHILLARPAL